MRDGRRVGEGGKEGFLTLDYNVYVRATRLLIISKLNT